MAEKAIEKLIDQVSGLTVLELVELTKALEEKFGVSAAMPVAAAPAAAAAGADTAAAEEKTEFKVELTGTKDGAKKVDVIKALRQVKKDMSLMDAKQAVVDAPTVIAEAAAKDEANKMKQVLEEAGALVKLS